MAIISSIQIHLMLLFIDECLEAVQDAVKFKYISCYCLSKTYAKARFYGKNSNTSHVIVYPPVSVLAFCVHEFKYISCYCLSGQAGQRGRFHAIQIHLMLLFIRKRQGVADIVSAIQIHLMLLFIS